MDLVTWDKDRMGMGYRTRRVTEYMVILQKPPTQVGGGVATRRHPRRDYGKGQTHRQRFIPNR